MKGHSKSFGCDCFYTCDCDMQFIWSTVNILNFLMNWQVKGINYCMCFPISYNMRGCFLNSLLWLSHTLIYQARIFCLFLILLLLHYLKYSVWILKFTFTICVHTLIMHLYMCIISNRGQYFHHNVIWYAHIVSNIRIWN